MQHSTVEENMHVALCQATMILNTHRDSANVTKAHDILREALQSYAGASPSDHVAPWMPYLSDRADGVQGRYAIARYNPILQCREVWNLLRDEWAAFSDEVFTEEEAIALLKTMSFAPTKHSRKKS